MGTNLQAHPDVVTIIKETSRMRAKYQTVMLRKYLQPTEVKTLKDFQANSTLPNSVDNIDSTQALVIKIILFSWKLINSA